MARFYGEMRGYRGRATRPSRVQRAYPRLERGRRGLLPDRRRLRRDRNPRDRGKPLAEFKETPREDRGAKKGESDLTRKSTADLLAVPLTR